MSRIRPTTAVALAAGLSACVLTAAPALAAENPTVVLVHGAFADTTSWDGVAAALRADGYRVVVPDNPLRGPANTAVRIGEIVAHALRSGG